MNAHTVRRARIVDCEQTSSRKRRVKRPPWYVPRIVTGVILGICKNILVENDLTRTTLKEKFLQALLQQRRPRFFISTGFLCLLFLTKNISPAFLICNFENLLIVFKNIKFCRLSRL